MSTNANILIENCDFVLYKHYDGYPDATLKWLEEFNKEFNENRGASDIDYKFAQLVRSSAFDCKKYNLDDSKSTGWGIFKKGQVPDVSFTYILTSDKVKIKY